MKINSRSPKSMKLRPIQGLFFGIVLLLSSCSAIDIFKENTEIFFDANFTSYHSIIEFMLKNKIS